MPYMPAPSLTGSDLTDSAGGTVSRTLDAAGAAYSQSSENKERSSLVDMLQELRNTFQNMTGKRGGGYRPIPTITTLTITGISSTGTTISGAGALYSQTNENEYRANLGEGINSLIDDINSIGGITGPRSTITQITDNSGGTPGSIASAGALYNQGGDNNIRATFADKLNEIASAIGA